MSNKRRDWCKTLPVYSSADPRHLWQVLRDLLTPEATSQASVVDDPKCLLDEGENDE